MRSSDKSNNPLAFRNLLAGVIVTVIGGVILAYIIQDARFTPRSAPQTAPVPTLQPTQDWSSQPTVVSTYVDVKANENWQNANMNVRTGETLVITYVSGTWSLCAPNGCPYFGSEGDRFSSKDNGEALSRNFPENVMVGCFNGGLIMRIADSQPVCVGVGLTKVASATGNLQFRINDTRISDNEGVIRVQVQIKR